MAGAIAIGTTNWSIPSPPLHVGTNIFTVTAHDDALNASTAALAVIHTPPAFPTMQVRRSGTTLCLSWLASPDTFVVQSADTLSTPILWSNVTAAAITNLGIVSVTVPATNRQQFFRVLKQP